MKPTSIIIGGSKGVGKVIAAGLVDAGHTVAIVSRSRPPEDLSARHYECDLAREESCLELVSTLQAANYRINHLVFAQRFRGVEDVWEGELQTSLSATRFLIEALAKQFADSGERSITIFGSSYGSRIGDSQPVSYHIAKGALEHLVRFYAVRLGKAGIRVNAVAPATYIKEESQERLLTDKALMDLYREIVPLGRLATAREVAEVVWFLCSPAASYVTGNIIKLDGAMGHLCPESLALSLRR